MLSRVASPECSAEELAARAKVIRSERTLKICAADVHAKKNGKEVHCATMLATIMCLPGKSDSVG
jgi:acyl-coenzyme A thioesterase PaaI-like protein